MTRTLDNLQEVAFYCDTGKTLGTHASGEISVLISRRYQQDESGRECPMDYLAHLTIRAARTDDAIATVDIPFSSVEELAELLGIDELEEVWEVFDP